MRLFVPPGLYWGWNGGGDPKKRKPFCQKNDDFGEVVEVPGISKKKRSKY